MIQADGHRSGSISCCRCDVSRIGRGAVHTSQERHTFADDLLRKGFLRWAAVPADIEEEKVVFVTVRQDARFE